MTSLSAWSKAWSNLGASSPDESLHQKLVACYSEPHRKYHTLQHLNECFSHLAQVRQFAEHPHEIEIALWFHDAIYETTDKNNEEKSANWAQAAAISGGLSQEVANRIHALVMATRHNAIPVGRDTEVLIDIDLGILGAEPERFAEYETQVKQEYAWVPAPVYKHERSKVLQEFLKRPSIYSTQYFRATYEERARENLSKSLAALLA